MAARSLNHMRNKVERAMQLGNDVSKLRSELYAMEKELKLLNSEIMKSLGEADTGNLDSRAVLDKHIASRRSVSVKTVESKFPELYDDLVVTNISQTIKFRK